MSADAGLRGSLPLHLAVFDSGVEVVLPRMTKAAFLASYWLRLAASKDATYANLSANWTDGANFQRYDNSEREFSAGRRDLIQNASLNERAGVLEVLWRNGFHHEFNLEDLRARLLESEVSTPYSCIPWHSKTQFQQFDYQQVMTSRVSLLEFLDSFLRYGLAFLNDAPVEETEILSAAARFSAVEPTHLGKTFHLRWTDKASNLGETADSIPLHIDLVYKQHPPDIQVLHVLRPADEGGENVFVDVLQVIEQLHQNDLRLLRTTPVVFMAKSDAVDFRGVHAILNLDDSGVQRVRYNEQKMLLPGGTAVEFYRAFLRFRDIINRPENWRSIRLPRGSVVIFDNARILHGRRSFKGGSRDVMGCFLYLDELMSKWRLLKRAAQVETFPTG